MYITAQEAAERVGVCVATLMRSDAPRLKLGHRTVRFVTADLDAWMYSKRVVRVTKTVPKGPGFYPQPKMRSDPPLKDRLVIPD